MELLSAPTILICTFLTMSSAALAMGVVWLYNREERAAGYWSVGFLLGALGGMSIALRTIAGDYIEYTIILHSLLVTSAYMFTWGGFRAFNGQKAPLSIIFSVPALWLITFYLWQPLRNDVNVGIAVQSGVTSVISLAAAYTVYFGKGNSRLPMTIPITAFLVTHGVFHFGHIWFAVFEPSPLVAGRVVATWWKLLMLEAFLHTVLIAISCIVLIKDRSEERHRIASETDILTGIANRRAFVKYAEQGLSNANDSAALALIDLDHFKQINDLHGHQAGDHALIAFANLVRSQLPEGACFGRMGGEEFAIYLPQSADQPMAFVENIRRQTEDLTITFQNIEMHLTISVGLATVEKAGRSFDLLVAAADCALYLAKEYGRNQSLMFSPSQRMHKILEKDGEKRIGLADDRISRRTTRAERASA